MVWAAIAGWRITVARLDDFGSQFFSAGDGGVKIVDLKPKQDAVAVWLQVGIGDRAVMMVDAPVMQLEYQLAVHDEPLIFRAAVSAFAPEQSLIPAARGLNIVYADERLRVHRLNWLALCRQAAIEEASDAELFDEFVHAEVRFWLNQNPALARKAVEKVVAIRRVGILEFKPRPERGLFGRDCHQISV